MIIAELVKSAYSKKTATQGISISGKSTNATACRDDTDIALDDSKADMEIKKTNVTKVEVTSPNIEEESDTDIGIEVKGESVSNYYQN